MATGVDARLLKSTKFPPEFSQKVDMQKVNLQVMKKWIASKISDILGNEDDVVIELVFNLIEGPRYPDIKSLQIQLTGFLDKDTAKFCKDLWKLLLSAQSSPQGVPKELLEAKKLELIQEKIEADRAAENAKQRRGDWERRDREVADMKDRDRRDRGATRGDTWQGRRGDRDFDSRGRGGFRRGGRRSRSPGPRARDSRDSFGRDSYVPRGRRGGGRADHARRKSPARSRSASASSRSSSRSRSGSRGSDQANRRRRAASPGAQGDGRKRARSPRGDSYRGRANRRGERDRPTRPSRSASSDRKSPAAKRRRYSSSRSRSVSRRRRRLSSLHALDLGLKSFEGFEQWWWCTWLN
ncbi:PWI domain-containing protein [Fusarium acuminatum]|uniref:PWI domain-containing protein n=1 Tax=Fusarium acuminatum TaxID=5515 RepID=A0ABZ2WGH6_9HYPO